MLAPILYVMDNEVDAFWCFAGLMERMVNALLSVNVLLIVCNFTDAIF